MTQDRCRCRSPHEGAAPSLSGPAHVPSGIAWSTGVGDEPANLSEACARVSAGRLLASTPARPVFGTWAFCERAGVRGCTGPRVGCAPVCRLRGGMLTAPCARPAPCTRARGKRPPGRSSAPGDVHRMMPKSCGPLARSGLTLHPGCAPSSQIVLAGCPVGFPPQGMLTFRTPRREFPARIFAREIRSFAVLHLSVSCAGDPKRTLRQEFTCGRDHSHLIR